MTPQGPGQLGEVAGADTVKPPHVEVTYNVLILPHCEIKKYDVKKRSGTSTIMTLHLDEPYDTFKAQILCTIDKGTSPATLSFNNYQAFSSIVRISSKPTTLSDEGDYKELIKRLKKTKESVVTIYVQELSNISKKRKDRPTDKENRGGTTQSSDDEVSSDEEQNCYKKKKIQKTKIPKASDIDDELKSIIRNIRRLTDRWEKGPEYATLEMPPNHLHFNMVPVELLGRQSLLAAHRQQLDEQAKKTAADAHAVPAFIFNINFPRDLFQAVRGPPAPIAHQPVISAPSSHLNAATMPLPPITSLLSATQLASLGPRMALVDFCSKYDISETVRAKLLNHGFNFSHALRYVTIEDLQKIGLRCGELAELRDAISRWCGVIH